MRFFILILLSGLCFAQRLTSTECNYAKAYPWRGYGEYEYQKSVLQLIRPTDRSLLSVSVFATGGAPVLFLRMTNKAQIRDSWQSANGNIHRSLAADTTYGNGEMLQWLDEHAIAGYIRVKENPKGHPTDLYGIDQFTYVPEENCYICPEGKPLKYVGIIRATTPIFIIRRRSAVASAPKRAGVREASIG